MIADVKAMSIRGWGAALLPALLLIGCRESVTVQREWPNLGAAKSALLVISRESPPFGPVVQAVAIGDSSALVYDVPPDDPAPPLDLVLILYDVDLLALGLPSGQIPLARPESRSRRIPAGTIHAGSTATDYTEWMRLDRMPDALAALRLEDQRHPDDLCPPLKIRQLELGDFLVDSTPMFALAVDDEHALVSTDARQNFLVTATEATRLTFTATIGSITGGYRAPDGELWLMSQPGNLYRGRIDTGFTKVASTDDPTSNFWALAGPTAGAPFELFALSSFRGFYRFDGTAWETLRPGTPFDLSNDGAVFWLRQNVAQVIGPLVRGVLRYDHGTVTEEALPVFGIDEVRTGGLFPGLGRVVSTAQGLVLQSLDEETWRPLNEASLGFTSRAMTVWGERLLFAGNDGIITTYLPDYGFCELQATGYGRFTRAITLGPRVLLTYAPFNPGTETRSKIAIIDP